MKIQRCYWKWSESPTYRTDASWNRRKILQTVLDGVEVTNDIFFLIKVLIVQSTRHGVFEQNSRIEMISEISMTWNKAWINPCLFDQFITSGVPFLLCSVKWADMRAVAWKNIIGASYVNIESFALMVSLWILNFRIIHLIWSFKLSWTSNLKVLTGKKITIVRMMSSKRL